MLMTSNAIFMGREVRTKKDGTNYNVLLVANGVDTVTCMATENVPVSALEPMEKYEFTFDYNSQYRNIKIVDVK